MGLTETDDGKEQGVEGGIGVCLHHLYDCVDLKFPQHADCSVSTIKHSPTSYPNPMLGLGLELV